MQFIRFSLILAFITLCSTVTAQQNKIRAAVLKESCLEKDPIKATEETLEVYLISLVDDEIISDLPEKNKMCFSLSVFFVLNDEGNVIPDHTEVKSESKNLISVVSKWVNNQPTYTPKDITIKERRSAYIVNLTFIRNSAKKKFHIATPEELAKKNIQPDYINYDQGPICGKCYTKNTYIEQLHCTNGQIHDYLKKHYRVPNHGKDLPLGMSIYFIIDSDGKTTPETFFGSSPDIYEDEVRRVIDEMPNIKPATIKGIPIYSRVGFSFILKK
ncbi:hypothetical protein [Flavobacterium cerinum]|uniref:TonB C-terminal domain-containing protein n=1 Tax=Flavobacterium cerinum TaxID=2502784 RepID=A0A444HFF6_9FLAO|nr:hypothetical protein [Flavobacterium cerinum]RWX03681.1 hypothetical protein EPI11_01775 [Flavobacterium cerinum]